MEQYWIKNAQFLADDDLTLQQGDLLIKDGRISGFEAPTADAAHAYEVIDAAHYLVLPGFVNAHTHVAMSLLRGYAGDMALQEWLNHYIWPAEAKLTDEDVYWGSALGLLEMLASGTTCFADMYDHMNAVAQAVDESGIRANLSRGMIGMNDAEGAALQENNDLYDEWHGTADDRIRVWYGPHAPNTCPQAYLERVIQAAQARKTGIHIHLSETREEFRFIRENHGKSPTAYLDEIGLFDVPTIAAHGVWLDESDRAILRKQNVSVAHNPVSNMKLASGLAPVQSLRAQGVNVAIGTDGASSNNNLSMLRDLQLVALVHKLQGFDPLALRGIEALQMATIRGAAALHWDDQIGSIKLGKKADLIFFDIDKPWHAPWHDLVENIAYAAHPDDVAITMVDGHILYRNGQYLTLDAEKIMAEASHRAKRIVGS